VRPTTAAAGAAALLLAAGLAACSGDPEPGSPLPTGEPVPSATGSAEPTGASPAATGDPSAPPTEQPVAAPTLPPEATTNDSAGAEAFVRYWYDALNYAYASGNTGPVMEASSDDCAVCAELVAVVDEAYSSNGRLIGGEITLLDVASPVPDDRGITLVSVLLDQEALNQVDEMGATVRSEPPSEGVSAGVVLERDGSDDGWLYYGAGR